MPSVRGKPSLEVFRLRHRLVKLASTTLNMTGFFRAQAAAARDLRSESFASKPLSPPKITFVSPPFPRETKENAKIVQKHLVGNEVVASFPTPPQTGLRTAAMQVRQATKKLKKFKKFVDRRKEIDKVLVPQAKRESLIKRLVLPASGTSD